jgi:hypothetical protein
VSYDVHIRAVHHPKHDEDENVLSTGFKMADPVGDPRLTVAQCLREYAAEIEEAVRRDEAAQAVSAKRAAAREEWLANRGLSS